MADKEAKIFLGIEGAGKAASDVMKVGGSFVDLADKLLGVSKIAKDVVGSIANIKPVNLTASTNQVEAYRDKVSRLGVTFHQTEGQIAGLMAKFDAVGLRVGQSADSVADATETLAKAYDLKTAVSMVEDLGIRANNTSRSLRDMSRDAIALKDGLTIPGNQLASTFSLIDQQAEKSGTVGGGQALEKRIETLSPILKKYDSSTPEKRAKLMALVAGVGKDLPPDEATQAAQDVLGSIAFEPQQIGRYVGRDILKSGKVDVDAIYDLSKKIRRSRGKDSALRTETALFGGNRQAANNFADLTPEKIEELTRDDKETEEEKGYRLGRTLLGQDTPDADAVYRQKREQEDLYQKTKAGKLNRAYIERDAIHRGIGKKLLSARDEYQAGYAGDRSTQVAVESTGGYLGSIFQAAGAARAGVKAAAAPTEKPDQSATDQTNLLKEQNQILREIPEKIGAQLRSDPNQASVDKARARPSN